MSESADTRPLKRTRLSDNAGTTEEAEPASSQRESQSFRDLRHHEEFWFEDGNLILTTQGVGFRVYRGLLASQSSIFADMFASSSANADEVFDGCPVVQMSDSPGDLAHLLRILLPKSQRTYYLQEDTPARPFDEIFGVVSLAHKYNIQDVQAQAIAALQDSGFSSDFERSTGQSQEKRPRVTAINAIGVVILARLTDTPSMLPVALYQCASMGGACVRGWKREDGSVEHLSSEDVARCFDGRNTLVSHEILLPSRFFRDEPSGECRGRGQCREAFRSVLVHINSTESLAKRRVLDDWTAFMQRLASNQGIQIVPGGSNARICAPCEKEVLVRHQRERMRIWKLLPEIFGVLVDGWPKAA